MTTDLFGDEQRTQRFLQCSNVQFHQRVELAAGFIDGWFRYSRRRVHGCAIDEA